MNTQKRVCRVFCIWVAILLPMTAVNAADTNSHIYDHRALCSAILPLNAAMVDSLQLCQSDHTGKNILYACQHFATADGKYRVYFKGGLEPKAIAAVSENGEVRELLWVETSQRNRPFCQLPPPLQVPDGASFKGAGVCLNDEDESIPCSVFRHKAPGIKTLSDYMVFYHPDGSGAESTSVIYVGVNQDAEPAEFAYQIGLSLLKTHCCRQRGFKYIARAHQLFPHYKRYQKTYLYFKQQLSSRKQSAYHAASDTN